VTAFEIGFFERSARLSDADLAFIIAAVNQQMVEQLAPAYRRAPWNCVAYLDIPPGAKTPIVPIRVLDDIGEAGALGFHTSLLGAPWGRVQTPEFPDDGTTFSHEAAEAWADPLVDQRVRMADGREMAFEVCDPCQRDSYLIEVAIGEETRLIHVSDCVLPSYFDPNGKPPFTLREQMLRISTIDRPFGIAPGGYAIVRDSDGETSAIYDEDDSHASRVLNRRATDSLSRSYRRGFRGQLEPLSANA